MERERWRESGWGVVRFFFFKFVGRASGHKFVLKVRWEREWWNGRIDGCFCGDVWFYPTGVLVFSPLQAGLVS